MGDRKGSEGHEPKGPKKPRSEEATILRLLREARGLNQDQVDQRAQLPAGRAGKYERDQMKLTVEDQRKILEGLDYPERAWAETGTLVRRLRWLRSRHASTRVTVMERKPDTELAGLVLEPDGRPDIPTILRELQRISETGGRYVEEILGDLLGVVEALLFGRKP